MRLSHIAWNISGLSLPLIIAATTVPKLIETLGNERFGLLALAWGLMGYAGAMDLGIGRALTQMVARMRGENKISDIPNAVKTAGRITLISGIIGAIAILLFGSAGGENLIKVHSTSLDEIKISILLLSIALPAQALSATYRGLNEAFLNFRGISVARAALGAVNFAGPYFVSQFTIQLPWLVATLVLSRLLALLFFRHLAYNCLNRQTEAKDAPEYSSAIARNLFSFGGWVTVSSIISPILVQADRFIIASLISAAAVSIYVIPYEVVVQSLILVGAVSSVMFPGLTRLIQDKPNEWQLYFRRWLMRVAGLMAFVCIGLAFLLPFLLPFWIKINLNPKSIQIGQILCLGVFANSIGSMFYALHHAQGRADLTAKIHIIELPIFLIVLYFLVEKFGLTGASWAWVGRMTLDALALALGARINHPKNLATTDKR